MPLLHDQATRMSIENRIRALRPETKGKWGKMSVDQMLWHVNQALAERVGERTMDAMKLPLPSSIVKFIVLRLPWTKSAPTNPAFVATATHDFEAERAQCLRLIAAFTAIPLDDLWPHHNLFGQMSGRDNSHLHAKHLDHHLKQFGV